ncbi:BQ2448_1566 [Microbotryum intermedium]|uniref:BQ2448_1566 protein n=1 Tax=Microbotryum intermedium TaxID=269621 RepID=A0A238F8H9_9BASI|nr:BQ2448_1566 [Microbotryum intermedium]
MVDCGPNVRPAQWANLDRVIRRNHRTILPLGLWQPESAHCTLPAATLAVA